MKARYLVVPVLALFLLAAGCGKKNDENTQDSAMKETNSQNNMETDKMNNSAGVEVGGAMMVPNLDIVDNAANANNVTTLVAAVKAAGLVETLKGPGPFTVFAPTNDAFAKLPAGTVDGLLKPENKTKLAGILTYHVVSGKYLAKDLVDGQMLTTVQGEKLKITKSGDQISINGSAMIQIKDVISSNGVTHVIDSVLMPS